MMDSYDRLPFPPEREIVVDAGYLGTGRHIIHGLLEVDVTLPRERLRQMADRDGQKPSFTAFLVASLGQTIAANPRVQAYRDWRGRLVVFHQADVVTMIEPAQGAVAIPHILRAADSKTVRELTEEIRSVQTRPQASPQRNHLTALAPRLPRFMRLFFFWALKKDPWRMRQVAGTAVLTSVGMFGKGGGWGLGFLPLHTLGLTVGGLAQKPGVHEGQITIREYLNLTLSFDHDLVDGAPAARFARSLVERIETAAALG
jgi:pyruvate/2-oxoglutarate dehydrogenase complex dihydrolipoamide acyltransferase (E2) component